MASSSNIINARTVKVSKSLKIPVVSSILDAPLEPQGSIVYDSSSGMLCVATQYGWSQLSQYSSSIPDSSISTRDTIDDIKCTTFYASKRCRIPLTTNITTKTLEAFGSLAFDYVNNIAYISTSSEWIPISGNGIQLISAGSVGSVSLVSDGVGPTVSTKGLIAGPGMTITSTATDITLSSSGSGPSYIAGPGINITGTTISNTGVITIGSGSSALLISGTPSNPVITGNYLAGTGMTLTGGNTFNNAGVLSVSAGNSTITVGGTASNPTVSGNYTAGTGISIVGNVITNTSPSSGVSLASLGTGSTLVINGTGPALTIRSIVASTAITISSSPTELTISGNYLAGSGISIVGDVITNTSPGSGVTLASLGTGNSMVVNGTGPSLTIKSLVASTGINIASSPTELTLSGTYAAGTGLSLVGTTFNNLGVLSVSAGDSTIAIGGTASNPTISGNYTAGTAINITGNSITCTISLLSEATGVGVYSILSDDTSPTFRTKTITAGSNITIADSGTSLTISSSGSLSSVGFSAKLTSNIPVVWPINYFVDGWTTSGSTNFDTVGGFVPATGIFTVPTSSIYSLNAVVSITTDTNAGSYKLNVYVNGVSLYTVTEQANSNLTVETCLKLSTHLNLTSGDVVRLNLLSVATPIGDDIVIVSGADTWWSMVKL